MKNINEEINRIKSLFNEERLYGNLINEQPYATDTDGDGNIDEPEAKDFLQSLDYSVEKLSDTDKSVAGFCYNKDIMKAIHTKYKTQLNSSGLNSNINSRGGMCFISSAKKSSIFGSFNLNKLVFWDNRYISFFVTLPYFIDISEVDKFKNTFDTLSVGTPLYNLVKANETIGKDDDKTKVQWLRYEAKIDGTYENYSSLKFLDFWDKSGEKMSLYGPLVNKFQEGGTGGYNPLNEVGNLASGRKYGATGLDLTTVLTDGSNGLGIGENGTISDLFDKLI